MFQRSKLGMSLSALLLGVVGCLLVSRPLTAAAHARFDSNYTDVMSYLAAAGEMPRVRDWLDVSARLSEAFEDICADTFCEGDYPNLTAISWRCSVRADTGELRQCVWTFAGSAEFIDASTGEVQVESTVVPCSISVHGGVEALVDGVLYAYADKGAASLLHRTLPGVDGTLYGALAHCL